MLAASTDVIGLIAYPRAAGAGSRTTIIPSSRPTTAARNAVSSGISSCSSSTSPLLATSRSCRSARSGVSEEFASGTMTMSFWPVSISTRICATPVGPATVVTALVSTPPSRRPPRTVSRKRSSPTQPIIVEEPPARAAASAWLAPLPPSTRVNDSPITVSPGTGSRLPNAVTSAVMLPTTTTLEATVVTMTPHSCGLGQSVFGSARALTHEQPAGPGGSGAAVLGQVRPVERGAARQHSTQERRWPGR